MEKRDKKAKTKKAKTATAALHDYCWYEPSCEFDFGPLCCDDACCC
jgi:hypothetical protein